MYLCMHTHILFIHASGHGHLSCFHLFTIVNNASTGTSLVVQWLRLCTPNAGGPGSIPGQGTRSHMPQLKEPAGRS